MQDVSIYAALLIFYVGLIVYFKEVEGWEDDRGLLNNIDKKYGSHSILSTQKFRDLTEEINKNLLDKPLVYFDTMDKKYKEFDYKKDSLKSNVQFIKHVRNNLTHGRKDFERRSEFLTKYSLKMINMIYAKILTDDSMN